MSSVPAVLSALTATFTPVSPARIEVIDGGDYDSARDALTVGFGGDYDEPAADVTVTPNDAGQLTFRWVFEVPCTLALHQGKWGDDGDVDVAVVCADALAAYRAALPTAVLEAGQMRPPYLSRLQWLPVLHDEGGATQIVRFWVHVETLDTV